MHGMDRWTDGYGPLGIGWILQLASQVHVKAHLSPAGQRRGRGLLTTLHRAQRLKGRFELACLGSLARSPPVRRPSVRP